MALNDDINDGLVKHNISLLRFDAQMRRQVRGQLRVLQEELLARLANYDFSNPTRKARLEALIRQVDNIIKGNYRKINSTMLGELADLAKVEHTFGAALINNLVGVDIVSAGLDPSRLRALARNSNIFGAPAREHWGRQSASMRRKFADNMRQGFLLGESTQDLVRRVRGTSTGAREIVEINGRRRSVHVFAGGIMDTTTSEAETLVRTSIQSVANEARFATYAENSDVIKSIQAQVTLDTRTSQVCIAHGAIPSEWSIPDLEPLNGSGPYLGPPPWHWNCRTSLIPITKSWQELQDQGTKGKPTRKQRKIARMLDNNAPKRMRSSMDGMVARPTGFEAFLNRQSKQTQIDMLGKTKWRLWKKEGMPLTQLIDQSGRPLKVSELLREFG